MIKHWKFAIQSCCYVLILLMITFGINYLFLPKKYFNQVYTTTLTYKNFYQMENNTVDVLFAGSSHAANAFNPQVLYDEYGFRSYNLGCEQQNVLVSYYWIKEALRKQRPKVVVFDPFMMTIYNEDEALNTSEACTRMAMDSMNMSRVKWDAIKDISKIDSKQDFNSFIFTNKRFHTRWTNLGEEDFVFSMKNKTANLKGFCAITKMVENKEFEPYASLETNNVALLQPIMEEYMDRIVEMCDENNIDLIFVKTPSKEWNVAKHNVVADYANKREIPFYDINVEEYYNKCGIEFEEDMGDEGHVNILGAEKITRCVGEWLSVGFDLESVIDTQWENSRKWYQAELYNMSIPYIDNFDEYISALVDKDYLIFVSVQYGIDGFKEGKMIEEMGRLGLDLNIPSFGSYCALVDSGNVIIENSSEDVISEVGNLQGGDIQYNLVSTNYINGGDTAITINGKNYSLKHNGINVVVFDKLTNKVVDAITYNGEICR